MPNQTTNAETRLEELGIRLPDPVAPVASYIPSKQVGSLLFLSGQIPMRDGSLMAKGHVPTDVSIEEAQACARQCVLNGLAVARHVLGSLDRIVQVVQLRCFIASTPDFTKHPIVGNGASDLLCQIFGDAGRHTRVALGSVGLPLGAPVEIEFVFEVKA